MNPKGTGNLDPKLRETYERVMGTTLPASGAGADKTLNNQQLPPQAQKEPLPAPIQPEPQAPSQEPAVPAAPIPEPLIQAPPEQEFVPKVEPIANEMVQSPVFKASDPFKDPEPPPAEVITNNAVVNSEKNKSGMLKPMLFGILGVVFVVVYAVVWAKVFGLF